MLDFLEGFPGFGVKVVVVSIAPLQCQSPSTWWNEFEDDLALLLVEDPRAGDRGKADAFEEGLDLVFGADAILLDVEVMLNGALESEAISVASVEDFLEPAETEQFGEPLGIGFVILLGIAGDPPVLLGVTADDSLAVGTEQLDSPVRHGGLLQDDVFVRGANCFDSLDEVVAGGAKASSGEPLAGLVEDDQDGGGAVDVEAEIGLARGGGFW